MVSSVPAMPAAMHKEMDGRAQQENEVRQDAQKMSPMLGPEKERRNDQEGANPDPVTRMTRHERIMVAWTEATHFFSPGG